MLVIVFFVTHGDSAVLVLGMMSTRCNPDPPGRVKLVWVVLVASIAVSLPLAGGLQVLQTATMLFAQPVALVIVLKIIALWRATRRLSGRSAARARTSTPHA